MVPKWIAEANQFDLYLYLDVDAPFVQDRTRLDENERLTLNESHKEELTDRGIEYHVVKGDWENRFNQSVLIIDQLIACNEWQNHTSYNQ